jgi:hypothetical protein
MGGYIRGKARVTPSKAQKELFLEIKKWAGNLEVVQEVIFPWSIGPKGAGYRYDIVVPDLRLIVEYDSLLHSKYSKHFHHSQTNFNDLKERDILKTTLARKNGWDIIRVDERDPQGGLLARAAIDRKLKSVTG